MFHCGDDLVGADLELQTKQEALWHSICLFCDHHPSPSAVITNCCQSYAHTPSRSDGFPLKEVVYCASTLLLGYLPPCFSSYPSRLRMIANWIGFPVSFVYFQNGQYSLLPWRHQAKITSEGALRPFDHLETSVKDSANGATGTTIPQSTRRSLSSINIGAGKDGKDNQYG